ncbi:MAG: DNA-processing protein DprA [Candidatus Zixiibacteriota bacterium]
MGSTASERIEKLTDLITLCSIDGIGAGRCFHLLERFQTVEKILGSSISDLMEVPGIGRELASNIKNKQNRQQSEEHTGKIIELGWKFFIYDEADYPEPLRNISDKPPYLFYLGDYQESDANAIAIVGSRSASEEGRHFAAKLAIELAENNITVVSGLARGIDIAAHRGSLHGNGRTIAVFGSSLDIIYPPEGRDMARQIMDSGCLISEHLPGTTPFGANFPKRNRIISGLSQGVVVIEAAQRSGALSTAGHALKQNREVFAVPGPPRHETSKGTNQLIKEGATLLTSVDDIFTELPRLKGEIRVNRIKEISDLTDSERDILNLFDNEPVHIDKISRKLEKPVSELMQILLALELKGIIKELSGKRYILE